MVWGELLYCYVIIDSLLSLGHLVIISDISSPAMRLQKTIKSKEPSCIIHHGQQRRAHIHPEVAELSTILRTSRIATPSVNQTFHSCSALAPMPIPGRRWTIRPSTHLPPLR